MWPKRYALMDEPATAMVFPDEYVPYSQRTSHFPRILGSMKSKHVHRTLCRPWHLVEAGKRRVNLMYSRAVCHGPKRVLRSGASSSLKFQFRAVIETGYGSQPSHRRHHRNPSKFEDSLSLHFRKPIHDLHRWTGDSEQHDEEFDRGSGRRGRVPRKPLLSPDAACCCNCRTSVQCVWFKHGFDPTHSTGVVLSAMGNNWGWRPSQRCRLCLKDSYTPHLDSQE